MTHIEKARAMLPEMPEEVFTMWIAEVVARNGWPFECLSDSAREPWRSYFCGLSLRNISELVWEKSAATIGIGTLHPDAQKSIHSMMMVQSIGMTEGFEVPDDSRDRWMRILSFVQETRELPCPVVLLGQSDHFRIFDGHHRLAVGVHVLGLGFTTQAWIANQNTEPANRVGTGIEPAPLTPPGMRV